MLNWTGRSSALSGRRRPRHTTFAASRGAARQAGTGRTSPSRKRKPEHGAMAVSGQGTRRRRRRIAANAKHATTARTHGTKSSSSRHPSPRPPPPDVRVSGLGPATAFAAALGGNGLTCEVSLGWANIGRSDHVHRPEPNALNTIEQWVV
jgi:hypothetical protein